MLALEHSDVTAARLSVRSLLSDMGVESGMWLLPDFSIPPSDANRDPQANCKLFPQSAPLADWDHMLHRAMAELEDGLAMSGDGSLWSTFDSQLSALSKVFSKRDHIELYVQANILENDNVPEQAKKALSTMFSSTCPSYCKSRWHYLFEVQLWLARREALIQWLEPEVARAGANKNPEDDLSKAEGEGLRRLAVAGLDRAIFWAVFWSVYIIQSWAFNANKWVHACPCPAHRDKELQPKTRGTKRKPGSESEPTANFEHKCPMNGRRLIELACGKAKSFARELKSLHLEGYQPAASALQKLRQMGDVGRQNLRLLSTVDGRGCRGPWVEGVFFWFQVLGHR